MASEPDSWQNRCPGDLQDLLPALFRGDADLALRHAHSAAPDWARTPLPERMELLRKVARSLQSHHQDLARGISRETGKPLRESQGEVTAVINKIELTCQEAATRCIEREVQEGPHPARVSPRPRGPALVIAPFNFPLHLGHGATVAHLLAGNPVILKPSPLAGVVASQYSALLQQILPPQVFQCVQGGADTALQLAQAPQIRSICFTGSIAAGRQLAALLAPDFTKDLALELGGKNAVIVCEDADLDAAATAIAEGMTLTAGQRCNATSRILAHSNIQAPLLERLIALLQQIQPGHPLSTETRLGPLARRDAWERHGKLAALQGDWILKPKCISHVEGFEGHYVTPGLWNAHASSVPPELKQECFCPIATVESFDGDSEALQKHEATDLGLTCSIFTRSRARFEQWASVLQVGNVYANLPTTFSPSTLPFGGWKASGNRHPGGHGFIRFTTDEQAMQWKADGFDS